MSPAREHAPSPSDLRNPPAPAHRSHRTRRTIVNGRAAVNGHAADGNHLAEDSHVTYLADRSLPGSKTRIESIAISPAGVFVVGTKAFKGLVHTRRHGPVGDLGPVELHIGRRNCTSTVEQLVQQVDAMRDALVGTPWEAEMPVQAVLCLTRAEWGFASPIEISQVWIGWPRLVDRKLRGPELMDSATVNEAIETVDRVLPSSR
jgi:hypothetical protein